MNQVAFRGTLIVLAHMIVLFGHGAAHSHLQVKPSHWQQSFIEIVIVAAPVVAAFLLWTRWRKPGIILLGVSLGSSFLFGLYYHFFAGGTDSALNPIHSHWNLLFSVTAVLLALVEITGCVWCIIPRRYFWNSALKAIES